MELPIYKIDGSIGQESIAVNSGLLEKKTNEHTIYYSIVSHMTNSRQGTHSSKSRSMVQGGGRKPYKQKGTGNARAGTIRSPLWRGGGRIFGPKPHGYNFKLPKKVRRLAKISAFILKLNEGKIKIIENFDFEEPKTKKLANILNLLDIGKNNILFVTEKKSENILKSSRNIPHVSIQMIDSLSTYELINCENLLIQKSAFEKINKLFENN